MVEFDEDGQRLYDERQTFEVLGREAETIIGQLSKGDTLVAYDGLEGEFQDEINPEEAKQYWADALGNETEGLYEGELPDPSELGIQFDSYGQIAPVEVSVNFSEDNGMGYKISTEVDHDGEEADLTVANTYTLGDASNPGELREMARRLDGETSEAFSIVHENTEW
jgi:hypothetical protein